MKDFRNKLLEDLLTNSGEFIDISYLLNKYCGEDNTFEPDDQSLIRCRLNINLDLMELKDMKWILIQPRWGFSSSHILNHDTNRRYFTHKLPVKVRMTTLGEIEYKKSKQEQIKQTSEIHIGERFTGNFIAGNASNTTQKHTTDDTESKSINKKSLTVNKWVLILTAVGVIVAIVLYLLQQGQSGKPT